MRKRAEKSLKIVLFSIFMFFLSINFVFAAGSIGNLNLNLSRTEYGSGQNYEGTLLFNMSGAVDSSYPVSFKLNNQLLSPTYTIQKIMSQLQIGETLPRGYLFNPAQSSVNSKINGSNNNVTSVGIDLMRAAEIRNIEFDLTAGASGITGLKLDLKSDGENDWTYVGQPLPGVFPNDIPSVYYTNDSYITDWATVGSTLNLDSESASTQVYCEKVNIKPSNEYIIQAKVGMKNPGGVLKGALIEGELPAMLETKDCNSPENIESKIYCCELNVKQGEPTDAFCNVNKSINDEKEVFACVFQDASISGGNYTIGEEAGSNGEASAFYNGNAYIDSDFLIRVFNHKFNTKLNALQTVHVSLDKEAVTKAGIETKSRLPITIYADSIGEVTFKNLKAGITLDAGMNSDVTSFSPVTDLPERINYSGLVSVPLILFNELGAPKTNLVDYNLVALVGSTQSNSVKFKVVSGPTAKIKVDNSLPAIGDIVNFDGSSSEANADHSIKSYTWQFGENDTLTGEKVKYTFKEEGKHSIKLIVSDERGISGSSTLVINVLGISTSILDQINGSLNFISDSISKLDKSNANVKETADSLGLISSLNSAKANLTILLKEANNINSDKEINESEKTPKYLELKTKYNLVIKDIPVDFKLTIKKFDSKVDSSNQIPTAKELNVEETDQFALKVFTYQDGVTVNGEATEVEVTYQNGETKDFILIKKTIIGDGIVYEILPSGLEKQEILTNDVQLVNSDGSIFRLANAKELIYLVSGDFDKVTKTLTIVIPQDVSSIAVHSGSKPELQLAGECGNNICELGESATCAKDCTVERPWLLIVLIFVLGGLGVGAVYYFMVLKKNTNLGFEKNLFKNENDHIALKKYIDDALHVKKFTEQQVSIVLKKKGWKDEQINKVIAEVKGVKVNPVNTEVRPAVNNPVKVNSEVMKK